jgi:hypothetical protein
MQFSRSVIVYFFTFFSVITTTQLAQAQSAKPKAVTKSDLLQEFSQDDTSKALINLFYRKRTGAILRGIGGGLAIARIATAEPSKQAQQLNDTDQTGPILLGCILASPFIITSITSSIKYKQETLLTILEPRQQGGFTPQKYQAKLKRKDFKD